MSSIQNLSYSHCMVPNILRISWTAVVHKSNGYIRQHHTHSYAPSCDPSRTVTQSAWFLNELLSRRRSLTCTNRRFSSDQIESVKLTIRVIELKQRSQLQKQYYAHWWRQLWYHSQEKAIREIYRLQDLFRLLSSQIPQPRGGLRMDGEKRQ